jgi:hypothetical protein
MRRWRGVSGGAPYAGFGGVFVPHVEHGRIDGWVITGRAMADLIQGDDGNDTLIGGDGVDLLEGAAGDDRALGGGGLGGPTSRGVLALQPARKAC